MTKIDPALGFIPKMKFSKTKMDQSPISFLLHEVRLLSLSKPEACFRWSRVNTFLHI